jgi:hypothetical protein
MVRREESRSGRQRWLTYVTNKAHREHRTGMVERGFALAIVRTGVRLEETRDRSRRDPSRAKIAEARMGGSSRGFLSLSLRLGRPGGGTVRWHKGCTRTARVP